jgi:hypothetical protein
MWRQSPYDSAIGRSGTADSRTAAPRAPWEICCADLEKEAVRSVLERLLQTGKLILHGDRVEDQPFFVR